MHRDSNHHESVSRELPFCHHRSQQQEQTVTHMRVFEWMRVPCGMCNVPRKGLRSGADIVDLSIAEDSPLDYDFVTPRNRSER